MRTEDVSEPAPRKSIMSWDQQLYSQLLECIQMLATYSEPRMWRVFQTKAGIF